MPAPVPLARAASPVGDVVLADIMGSSGERITVADVGRRCMTLPGKAAGTIRFVGNHHVLKMPRVGIELDSAPFTIDKPVGSNDGEFR